MKILNIQSYTNKFTPKISFCNNDSTHKESLNKDEFYKDNFNDTYNTEYKPVKYEKTTLVKGRPLILNGERMFRQSKDSFRDSELFYDDIDSIDYVPTKYDNDDVPLDRNILIRPFRKLFSNYAPNIDISDESFGDCYEALYEPWKNVLILKAEEEQEKYEDIICEELRNTDKADYKTIKDIFKSSSILKNGREQVDCDLCNLAVKIFRNSKTWDDTEKGIMDEIKIPIYKKVYGGISPKKYEYVDKCICYGYSNESILDFLRDFYPGYVLDLSSIMTKEEAQEHNKNCGE